MSRNKTPSIQRSLAAGSKPRRVAQRCPSGYPSLCSRQGASRFRQNARATDFVALGVGRFVGVDLLR